jgi:uncharacterized protein (DUF58 family)
VTTAPDRLLRRLEWHVVRRLDGRLQGAYRTVFRGTGIDFADLREYMPEDDVRHIDWNVTARMDEPYVRQYTQDRDLTAWLVLDRSPSMRFGAEGHDKDTVVTELAICLGRLFSQAGNRVGVILFDNRYSKVIPPRTGRNHLLHLIAELTKPTTAGSDGRSTDLDAMLRLTASTARRRGLVFVVSDFISDGDWQPALTRLAQRHEVVAIRVVDPAETDLPDVGLVVVEDSETGEQLFADTGDPVFRERLRAQVSEREAALAAAMHRAGAVAHQVDTGEDLTEALIDMVRRSKRRRA